MKKQILGCFAVLILSVTAISASKQHAANITVNSYAVLTDTIPSDSNNWNRNKRDTSMNHSWDTTRKNRDSTLNK